MRSVFFATDCIEDMHVWMQAMSQAAAVQLPPGYTSINIIDIRYFMEIFCILA